MIRGKTKALDMDDDGPVDPVADAVDDGNAPAQPIGAQFITGLHAILMEAAKFYNENSAQLEPETAQDFAVFEKAIMGAVSMFAKKLQERYPDLPGLDGAEWVDPDTVMDEDGDGVDDEIDVNVDTDKEGEDDVTVDDESDTGDEKTGGFDDADNDGDSKEDDTDDDDEIEKSLKKRTLLSLKSMLFAHLDRQAKEEKRRTQVQVPSAIMRLKSVAAQLHSIRTSSTVSVNADVRLRLKGLQNEIVGTLPEMERPAFVPKPAPKPVEPKFDEKAVLAALNATAKKLASQDNEIKTLTTAMGG